MKRRNIVTHRIHASTPPTQAEAWAAVLDNPRLVYRLAEELGGGEDAVADAQIALMETFPRLNPGMGNVYRLARWHLLSMHRFIHRLIEVPNQRTASIERLVGENLRRDHLGLPRMRPERRDRIPPDGTVTRFLLEGTWRDRIEPAGVDGGRVRIGERVVSVEDLVTVDPVDREDLWRDGLYAALRTLTPREKRVLRAIVLDEASTKEVGGKIGTSKQRVSQILLAVLRKLRTQLDARKEEG